MNNYKQYYQTVVQDASTTGQKPTVKEYFWIQVADNIFIILLFTLTILFASVGLFCTTANPDGAKWALDNSKLCLGVFLGLFAGKKL
ncbi:MAG TPA: hypothetical protein VGM58_06720 [Verrucomicrobiae bacterium]|jgi:hypothetical protein